MRKTLWAIALAAAPLAPGAGAQEAVPSDAQIAAIVVTANQVDIDAGRLAANRGASQDVRAFAQLMVQDHGGVNQAATELARKLRLAPEPNATSAALQAGGEANLAKLRQLSGSAFDRAYVQHEVRYHETVLDALDKSLVPYARNAELKALLLKVRPAFVAHLDHARHLAARLEPRRD